MLPTEVSFYGYFWYLFKYKLWESLSCDVFKFSLADINERKI